MQGVSDNGVVDAKEQWQIGEVFHKIHCLYTIGLERIKHRILKNDNIIVKYSLLKMKTSKIDLFACYKIC